jgi:hypothetical protein
MMLFGPEVDLSIKGRNVAGRQGGGKGIMRDNECNSEEKCLCRVRPPVPRSVYSLLLGSSVTFLWLSFLFSKIENSCTFMILIGINILYICSLNVDITIVNIINGAIREKVWHLCSVSPSWFQESSAEREINHLHSWKACKINDYKWGASVLRYRCHTWTGFMLSFYDELKP